MSFVPALGFLDDVVDGSDGAIWVSASGGIGRVTPSLEFTAFRKPRAYRGNESSQIAWSVDGSLWSVEGPDLIRMTPDGRFTAFKRVAIRAADVIARPDGSMWFSDPPGHRIRAITSDGTVRDIDARLPSDAEPWQIAATADGSVWFSDVKPDGGLGRVRPDGTVTRMFHGQDRFIRGIAAGNGDDLWFVTLQDPGQDDGPAIGRVTSGGTVVSYRVPEYSSPSGITVARDGNVWFANRYDDGFDLGRLGPDGKLTFFFGAAIDSAYDVAAARDGSVWFIGESELGWLPANACVSRRRFTLTIRSDAGNRIRSAKARILSGRAKRESPVSVAGTTARVLVDLRGYLPATVTVVVKAKTASGRRIVIRRAYRTCQPRATTRD